MPPRGVYGLADGSNVLQHEAKAEPSVASRLIEQLQTVDPSAKEEEEIAIRDALGVAYIGMSLVSPFICLHSSICHSRIRLCKVLYPITQSISDERPRQSLAAARTFVLLMVLHPQIQKRAQDELDDIVGPGQTPSFEDLPKLVYLDAVMREVFRWHREAPLGEDSQFNNDIHWGVY